eukprot:7732739-Pyramimonas_sp.AAC.1
MQAGARRHEASCLVVQCQQGFQGACRLRQAGARCADARGQRLVLVVSRLDPTAHDCCPSGSYARGLDRCGSAPGRIGAECIGIGSLSQRLLIFGDASGGPESRFPSLRRVGLGLVVMTGPITMTIGPKIAGPLTGR